MLDVIEIHEKLSKWATETSFRRALVILGCITFIPMAIYAVIGGVLLILNTAFDFIRGGDHWEGKWVPVSPKEGCMDHE